MNHRDKVLLHMLGQSTSGGAGRFIVTVADVKRWFGWTAQGANKKLRQLMDEGYVQRIESLYRRNSVKHYYGLSDTAMTDYHNGVYKQHYIAWIHDQPIPF